MWGIFISLIAILFAVSIFGFIAYALFSLINKNRDADQQISISNLAFRDNITLRIGIIVILATLLLIPLSMVSDIIDERRASYQTVLHDISSSWAEEQTLTGPLLVIPFTYRWETKENKINEWGEVHTLSEWHQSEHEIILLPDDYQVHSEIDPEYRSRGIYNSLVYRNRIKISGNYQKIEERIRQTTNKDKLHKIHWDKSFISIGLSDPAGIEDAKNLLQDTSEHSFSPGSNLTHHLNSGVHLPLKLDHHDHHDFDLILSIKGSHGFKIIPVGERSEVQMTSSWEHPSFYGDLLPAGYTIDKGKGFTSEWSVLRLVRSFPQQWINASHHYELNKVSLGVRLFEPVTLYTTTTRAVKYGILFIGLTFACLLIIEWIKNVRTGFLQYLMIGAALSLFYLLLIALSEHIGFAYAYLLSALTTIAMIGLYSLSILKRSSLTMLIGVILTTLYVVLYLILLSEDYALLSGTVLITVTLAASMYFTRNLQTLEHKQEAL